MKCIRCNGEILHQVEFESSISLKDEILAFWERWCNECQNRFMDFIQYPNWAKHRIAKHNNNFILVKYVGMSEAYFRLNS